MRSNNYWASSWYYTALNLPSTSQLDMSTFVNGRVLFGRPWQYLASLFACQSLADKSLSTCGCVPDLAIKKKRTPVS